MTVLSCPAFFSLSVRLVGCTKLIKIFVHHAIKPHKISLVNKI